MRRFALSIGLFLGLTCAACAAFAQSSNVVPPVQQSSQRLDAATGVCALATAVNATQAAGTCTISPPAGQYVYFTYMQVAQCQDGTASISGIQLNFTSTGLNGWVQETSFLSAATITSNNGTNLCAYVGGPLTTPLKSASPGGVVTIVPPAQTAHVSFPIVMEYYFSN
jgi:hypothetical protein